MKLGTAVLGSLLVTIALFGQDASAQAAKPAEGGGQALQGAGATFPAPLYKQWIAAYKKVEPSTSVKYAVIGSGEGTTRFLADTVDFGASDAALSDAQIGAAPHGAVLIPATAGMVVLAYNLPGLNGPLKLSRETYVALLMGKIPRWNDARIASTNPGLNLPDREITLVARLDGSGTTFALTNHLSAISTQWRDLGPGVTKLVAWPAGTMLVRGNEGVAARIKQSVGSVGYIEYGFAKVIGMPVALLENKEGKFVAPSPETGEKTLTSNLGRIPANLRAFIPDPDGAGSYPIVTFSWLLLKERYADPDKAAAVKRFVAWGLSEGQRYSVDLGYIPLPPDVAGRAKAALTGIR
jgi:phosphate transport system substrate-binding protein